MTTRRALPLAALVAALALAGCGDTGTKAKLTGAQEQARVAFIEAHGNYSDRELAHLCPGLYPKHFLTNTDKYPLPRGEKNRTPPKITAHDLAEARAAACDVRP
jgi:hypothetical protein